MKEDPWKDKWERGDPLDHGNQAHTFLAKKPDDPPGQYKYVLKKLKRQNDPIRRGRMHAEVAALETLDHRGIAKLIDSNAHEFKEDVEMYLVCERIEGIDLEAYPHQHQVSLDVATRILLRVLEILKHCHQREVCHRDIKPCHIILRDCKADDPVLIDFGLAFKENLDRGFETASDQGVGNRSLILPEQMGDGEEKRDPRSDITQCVGVYYHLLTKRHAGLVRGPDGRKPHTGIDLAAAMPTVLQWKLERLRRVLDVGFEYNPDERWQSIETLMRELEGLLADQDPNSREPFTARLKALRERYEEKPTVKREGRINAIFHRIATHCDTLRNDVRSHFDRYLHGVGGSVTNTAEQWDYTFHFQRRVVPVVERVLLIRIVAQGAEFGCFWGEDKKAETPFVRVGVFDPLAEEQISKGMEGVVLEYVKSLFSDA